MMHICRVQEKPRQPHGLAIVKALVAAHDGELNITSEVGAGTTVTVRLKEECLQHRSNREDQIRPSVR